MNRLKKLHAQINKARKEYYITIRWGDSWTKLVLCTEPWYGIQPLVQFQSGMKYTHTYAHSVNACVNINTTNSACFWHWWCLWSVVWLVWHRSKLRGKRNIYLGLRMVFTRKSIDSFPPVIIHFFLRGCRPCFVHRNTICKHIFSLMRFSSLVHLNVSTWHCWAFDESKVFAIQMHSHCEKAKSISCCVYNMF